jgi:hypothetical protein
MPSASQISASSASRAVPMENRTPFCSSSSAIRALGATYSTVASTSAQPCAASAAFSAASEPGTWIIGRSPRARIACGDRAGSRPPREVAADTRLPPPRPSRRRHPGAALVVDRRSGAR